MIDRSKVGSVMRRKFVPAWLGSRWLYERSAWSYRLDARVYWEAWVVGGWALTGVSVKTGVGLPGVCMYG